MQVQTLINDHKTARAIVVGIVMDEDMDQVKADLQELSALLTTLGIPTVGVAVQKRQKLSASHLLGLGKLEELKLLGEEAHANLIVIDHTISGIQSKNLEQLTGCQVLDRSAVILDIFTKSAQTRQAQTQVEIAKLEYLLPRLVGAWSHLERQGGGGGAFAKGMGEKQLEIDKRRARERISRLRKRLEHIGTEKATQRKARSNELKVSLVGYTNSGKTTLMKTLTRAEIEGKDELFATLDTSVRVIDPSTRPRILLSDTVGFIRKLPHNLIASFKATLDEVVNANLLLHVVDMSHPQREMQIKVTTEVLEEIGAGSVPTIIVFNKVDKVEDQLLRKILKKKNPTAVIVSAYNGDDITKLRDHIFSFFETKFAQVKVDVPVEDATIISLIYSSCVIISSNYEAEGHACFEIRAPSHVLAKLERYTVAHGATRSKP